MTKRLVIESPHVGALMDIGQARIVLEAEAKALGSSRFGEGYHDFVGGAPLTAAELDRVLPVIASNDPQSWSTILRASLLVAQASEGPQDLLENVKHIAVLATAWLEDIQSRTPVGIEP